MKKIWNLIKIMFRIGCIGFGGGSALIPVIEKETITRKKMVSKEEFDKDTIVASVTPGALPVEIASGIGYTVAGEAGMVASAISMALPGAVFTILLLTIFSNIKSQILEKVNILSVFVSLFIIYLLLRYIGKVIVQSKVDQQSKAVFAIFLSVFLLNGGKEIRQLFGIPGTPLFDLSSIQIMGMAFFLIFFLTESSKWYKYFGAFLLCLVYALCSGKAEILAFPWLKNLTMVSMFLLGAYGLFVSVFRTFRMHKGSIDMFGARESLKKIRNNLLVWLGILIVSCLPILCVYHDSLFYIGRGLLSSFLSFGGGDAYLSVAEGMFVNTGMLEENIFFEQLVTIVNILPGSILCKTLSGAGYLIGYSATKNIGIGLLMALAGFGVSVFGSCSIFMCAYHVYSELENIHVFKAISRWLRPVIGGTLFSICLSLLKNIINIVGTLG